METDGKQALIILLLLQSLCHAHHVGVLCLTFKKSQNPSGPEQATCQVSPCLQTSPLLLLLLQSQQYMPVWMSTDLFSTRHGRCSE